MSTKNEVLKVLEQNRGHSVSGHELAEKLNITRASIWKAVKSLQDDGHKIIASTNRGYLLAPESDVLSEEGIRLYLSEDKAELPVSVYRSVDSTNSEAKRLLIEGSKHGMLIIAETQTAGRGRYGRSFFSPPGTGIYMSLVINPQAKPESPVLITVYTAAAVTRAIEKLTGLNPQIKWVNDIYLGGKKICGILTEAVYSIESGQIDNIITGIGINFSTAEEDFPEDLRKRAGSLSAKNISRNRLAAEIVNEISYCLDRITESEIIAEYKNRSCILGKQISYEKDGIEYSGIAEDINEHGNLIVRLFSGEHHVLISGEVSIRK